MSNPADKASVAESHLETISFLEAIKRSDELRARAIKARAEFMAKGNDARYAENVPLIPIICTHFPALSPAQGDGFPVIKIPGHIVNHMEWKDGAIIVTVTGDGMRDALVKARGALTHALECGEFAPDGEHDGCAVMGECKEAIVTADAALASHPDRQPGMTDKEGLKFDYTGSVEEILHDMRKAAIAAIKRASQRQ